MEEYEIAATMCIGVFALIMVSILASELWQRSWAWIDDDKYNGPNWVGRKLTLNVSKFKYPVYLQKGGEIFGYSSNKEYDGAKIHDYTRTEKFALREGRDNDFIYTNDILCDGPVKTILILSVLPMLILLSIKVYPLVIGFGTLAAVAHLARFSRRTKKVFDKHVLDKDAHKKSKSKKEVNNETSK